MGTAMVCSEEVCISYFQRLVICSLHSSRPYLNVYAHSDENEETAVIGLTGVNIEYNPAMESLLGVRLTNCH